MGAETKVDVVSVRVAKGDRIDIEGVSLVAVHTPGHTDDSYSFRMADRVFTGDTLLIRSTGRTDSNTAIHAPPTIRCSTSS
jgi:sulfur dioxygenase